MAYYDSLNIDAVSIIPKTSLRHSCAKTPLLVRHLLSSIQLATSYDSSYYTPRLLFCSSLVQLRPATVAQWIEQARPKG